MSITQINANDLRAMKNKEGLILQGCGGDLNEWVDGINGLLTDEGILLDGTKFENCSAFTHDGVTCILYPFEDAKLDAGKLAMCGSVLTDSLAVLGFRTTFPTASAVSLSRAKTSPQKEQNPTAPSLARTVTSSTSSDLPRGLSVRTE